MYIFGGYTGDYWRLADVLKYDPETNTVTQTARLPEPTSGSCAVAVGPDEILIIGGYTWAENKLVVTRFVPSTQRVTALLVTGDASYLYSHACTYVEKQDRVYIFGGYDGSPSTDKIYYMDLGGRFPQPSRL